MILTWSRGRLGNQFFQYSLAHEAAEQGEIVVLIGFEELAASFPRLRGLRVPIPNQLQKFSRRVHRFAKRQVKSGWIGHVDTDSATQNITRERSRLPVFLVIDELGQIDGLTSAGWVYEIVEPALEQSLASTSKISSVPTCFVHVRRTDYAEWPRPDIPATLPNSWYAEAMEIVGALKPDTEFRVFTDDPDWVRSQSVFANCELMTGSAVEDWLAMTSCDAGILSPSSFAYWAAIIAHNKRNADGPFVAPDYWGAWRIKEWYPRGMIHAPFRFLPVPNE